MPRDDFAFQPCKPDLDVIQPGRICRREVKLRVGIPLQKLLHLPGLVCRQIVQNDVNVLMRFTAGDDLFEEVHELGAGVALGSLALHLSGLHIQRRAQRQRAVASIFKPCRSSRPGDDGSTGSSRSSA
jgi:hypothetical protein